MTRWILALDGGGIRGAASARFLERLELELGRPLAQVFDLYAGTSTGAIIAGALGIKGMTARQISSLYDLENANTIMDKSPWDRVAGLLQTAPKYDGRGKRQVLDRFFGKTTLGEAQRNTLIVAYDVEKRKSAVLKTTHPEHRQLLAAEAIDASSAAPIYFPTVSVGGRWLIDGGVVANNPTLCAYAEGMKCWPGEEIRVLSVGTGKRTRQISGKESRGWGATGWIVHDLLGVVMDESVVEYQAETLLGDRYLRVNSDLTVETGVYDDLDETSATNLAALKRLGDAWFTEFGATALSLLAGAGKPAATMA
jgi:uncharacterized protein